MHFDYGIDIILYSFSALKSKDFTFSDTDF